MVPSIDGGDAKLVAESATDGRLLPNGRLAFMRLGTLATTVLSKDGPPRVAAPTTVPSNARLILA